MPEPVAISELAGRHIDAVHPQLLVLYRACFSGPPWSETEDDVVAYGNRVRGWAQLDSFTGLLAHDPGGALVGAAYGWRGPAEAHGIPLPGAPAGLPFHVADLMVHPDCSCSPSTDSSQPAPSVGALAPGSEAGSRGSEWGQVPSSVAEGARRTSR